MIWLFLACARAPDAPDGVHATATHLLREFHGPDAQIAAGLTGLLDWYDTEGAALVDGDVTLDDASGFRLPPPAAADLAGVVIPDGADPADLDGLFAIARAACDLPTADRFLVRRDSPEVWDRDYDAYERRFLTDRVPYDAATDAWEVPAVDAAMAPGDVPAALLHVQADITATNLGITLAYTLDLRFRHGTWDVAGDPLDAIVILGHFPASVTSDGGDTTWRQNDQVEVLVPRDGELLWFGFYWNDFASPFVDSEDALYVSGSIGTLEKAAERLTALCAGEVDVGDEPPPP